MFGRSRSRASGRPLFERILFTFMGPADRGELTAPPSVAADPATALCHKCGRPWEEHERVHTSSMTYVTCPGRDSPARS